ncbi:MAG: 16S rRNA (adenine(1518)-N(6)/adenine(1519)-N(6))-dimethyltransferase RsmA [Bacteroidetes bacterium]|nr:16S rRNA (adenine(1518)-N(6)/adenine(1519)-N(6))-dimethyltransferase RsmA [Bacteroidota bacterium]
MSGVNKHFGSAAPRSGEVSIRTVVAKKSLGQNFLVDDNIARKIVRSAGITKDDVVIEIGPGKGALTRFLLATGARIEAVEKDNILFRLLSKELVDSEGLTLVNDDFLDYSFAAAQSLVKILGNIPYNLTSRIVSRIVDERQYVHSAVLMVQDEVAARLAASAGTKEYGSISVRLNLVADVTKLFPVNPTCFRPRPKVNSRVIKIAFRHRGGIERESEFVDFVKKAFGMRRKMFRHFAAHYYGKDSIDLLEEKYRTSRIETMAPEEIYGLFSILEHDVRSN